MPKAPRSGHNIIAVGASRGGVEALITLAGGSAGSNLLAGQSEALEKMLWAALSLIEERAALRHRLAARERDHDQAQLSSAYEEKAQGAERHAVPVPQVLTEDGE